MTKRNLVRALWLGASVLMLNGSGRAQTDQTLQQISDLLRGSGSVISGDCGDLNGTALTGLFPGLGASFGGYACFNGEVAKLPPGRFGNPGLPMPTDGILSDLVVASSAGPQYEELNFRLYVNDVATSLGCTITIGTTTNDCQNRAQYVCVRRGDRIKLQMDADKEVRDVGWLHASFVKTAQESPIVRSLLTQLFPGVTLPPNPCQ